NREDGDHEADEVLGAPTGGAAAVAEERAALERLRSLTERSLTEPSAKYDALLDHLRSIGVGAGKDMRAVVFAERVATLGWLQQKLARDLGLSADGENGIAEVAVLHGGLSDVEQQAVV